MSDITPQWNIIPMKDKVVLPDSAPTQVLAGQTLTGGSASTATGSTQGKGNNSFNTDASQGIWLGSGNFATAPFSVTMAGVLTATKGTFSGQLLAGSIDIPNATSANSFHVDANGNAWWGAAALGSAVASILSTGVATFKSGTIGGWTIGATAITDTAGTTGMSSAVTAGDDIRFWAGNATPASAPFRVTESGVLSATSGTIGGWTLGSTTLSGGNLTFNSSTGVISSNGNAWTLKGDGTTTGIVPVITNHFIEPLPKVPTSNSSISINSNTTQSLGLFELQAQITVTSISIEVVSVTAAGTIDITIYSEDGQTQLIAVTTGTISATGEKNTAVASVKLKPGNYYFAVNSNSTTNISVNGYSLQSSILNHCSGKAVLSGTQTITAGTPANTFTPSALSYNATALIQAMLFG